MELPKLDLAALGDNVAVLVPVAVSILMLVYTLFFLFKQTTKPKKKTTKSDSSGTRRSTR